LGADGVYVGQLLELAPQRARTIAWWKDGRHADNVVFDVTESPYRTIWRMSFVTHPLTNAGDEPIGHIAAVRRGTWKNERAVKRLLATCASRIAGEVERYVREHGPQHDDSADAAHAGRREQDLADSARQKDTLLREVHHRVKNNLQIVASLLTMQAGTAGDRRVSQALSDAVARISTIALIHAQLCEGPSLSSVDMRTFVHELVSNVRRTLSDSSTTIATALRIDSLSLPLHLATPCGLIISELLTNAFQHAFTGATRGTITIELTVDGRVVILTVNDDGRGLPADAEGTGSKGLGLQLVHLLATRQLQGRVSVSRDNGTTFVVTFPFGTTDSIADSARDR
jgi:two-component sensor histidine kinase